MDKPTPIGDQVLVKRETYAVCELALLYLMHKNPGILPILQKKAEEILEAERAKEESIKTLLDDPELEKLTPKS